ncbi:hypothetical protein L195_g059676, partial [Trifolium pratense]
SLLIHLPCNFCIASSREKHSRLRLLEFLNELYFSSERSVKPIRTFELRAIATVPPNTFFLSGEQNAPSFISFSSGMFRLRRWRCGGGGGGGSGDDGGGVVLGENGGGGEAVLGEEYDDGERVGGGVVTVVFGDG